MYDSQSKGISYAAGFFMLIAFAIAGILIFQTAAVFVWQTMTGLNATEFSTAMTNPAYSTAYKVAHVVSMLGMLVPAHIVASVLNREPLKLLGLTGNVNMKQLGMVVLICCAALAVGSGLSYVTYQIPIPTDWKIRFDKLEAEYLKQAEAILSLKSTGDYLLALVVMAFLPAFCEEALFRGGLQNFLTRSTQKPWLAILIVSLIFSLAHFLYYGFLFRFLFGAVLGLIYHYSGRLWLSIWAHFLNNALVVTIYYYSAQQGKSIDEAMEGSGRSYLGLLAIPVLVLLFMVYKRMTYGSAIISKRSNDS
jgi:membrane protease YdiL (CAAX protease family)